MNILITGASGFIGSYIYESLSLNHNVFKIVSNIDKAIGKNYIVANLEKIDSVDYVLESLPAKASIDLVIHLAAKLSTEKTVNNINVLASNIMISENVAKISAELCPKKLINFSSTSVYPNTTGVYSEESLPGPQHNSDCYYGLSKLASEVILDYLLENSNIEITHLRIGQVYGDGMRKDRLMPSMLDELKKTNSITVYANGKRTSNFIEVNELTKIISIFVENNYPGIYNIGSENKFFYDIARDLIDKHGDESSTIVKKSFGNDSQFNLDLSKLNSIK